MTYSHLRLAPAADDEPYDACENTDDHIDDGGLEGNDTGGIKFPRRKLDAAVLEKFHNHTPLSLYLSMVHVLFMHIIKCTNERLPKVMETFGDRAEDAHERSRMQVEPLGYNEFITYNGLRLTMSMVRLPHEDFYWQPQHLAKIGVEVPSFRKYMRLQRYKEIKASLQFDSGMVNTCRMDEVTQLVNESLREIGEDCKSVELKGSTRRQAMAYFEDVIYLMIANCSNIYRQIHKDYDHMRYYTQLAANMMTQSTVAVLSERPAMEAAMAATVEATDEEMIEEQRENEFVDTGKYDVILIYIQIYICICTRVHYRLYTSELTLLDVNQSATHLHSSAFSIA